MSSKKKKPVAPLRKAGTMPLPDPPSAENTEAPDPPSAENTEAPDPPSAENTEAPDPPSAENTDNDPESFQEVLFPTRAMFQSILEMVLLHQLQSSTVRIPVLYNHWKNGKISDEDLKSSIVSALEAFSSTNQRIPEFLEIVSSTIMEN